MQEYIVVYMMYLNTKYTQCLKQKHVHTKMPQTFGENKFTIEETNYKQTWILEGGVLVV